MRWFSWNRSRAERAARLSPTGLEWRVRRALRQEPRLRDLEAPWVRVDAREDGEVILAGLVSTREARDLAVRIARGVPGVARVTSALRTDDDATRELRARLAADPRLAGLAGDSLVFHGTAELRGSATEDGQRAAIDVAEGLDGIRRVENYAQLAKGPAVRDAA